MIFTIIVNDAPYGIEKPWNALRLASTSITDEIGMTVRVFLMGDSVAAAKKGQKTPDGYYNMEKMLTSLT
ncbi:MAG: DsrE/DsrF/TusD sulfur relay family protein, partial [bacterium]